VRSKTIRLTFVYAILGVFLLITPASASVNCDTYTYRGDDDSAYAANLPFTLTLGSTEYTNVFITTNGTMTFGVPDGNFGTYPQTPSVSVAGYDWVTFGEGAYLSFGSTPDAFCAEWSVRPYPQSTGELTQIRLVINRYPNDGWHGEIVTFGWLPADLRRGIRFEQGAPVVPIEAAFDVNGGVPIEVTPAPTPSSFTQEPEIPVTPTPTPSESIEPTVEPTIEPTPSETPTPEPTVEPTPEPSESPTPTPSPSPSESVIESPTPTPSPTQSESISPTPSPSSSETLTPVEPPSESPTPDPVATPEDPVATPSPSEVVELASTTEAVTASLEDSTITEAESAAIVDYLLQDSELTSGEVTEISAVLLADGELSADEKDLLVDVFVAAYEDVAVPFDLFELSGLDYEDLPPDQPVSLENGVVVEAVTADLLEVFNEAGELLSTLAQNPAKALKAVAVVGLDMTPESRETAQSIVVSAVVTAQIAQVRKP
jgi:hypothetical protein